MTDAATKTNTDSRSPWLLLIISCAIFLLLIGIKNGGDTGFWVVSSLIFLTLRTITIYKKSISLYHILLFFVLLFMPLLIASNLIGDLDFLKPGEEAFGFSLKLAILLGSLYLAVFLYYVFFKKRYQKTPALNEGIIQGFEEIFFFLLFLFAVNGVLNIDNVWTQKFIVERALAVKAILGGIVFSLVSWEKHRAPMLSHIALLALFLIGKYGEALNVFYISFDKAVEFIAEISLNNFWLIVGTGLLFLLISLLYIYSTNLSWKSRIINAVSIWIIEFYIHRFPKNTSYAKYRHFNHRLTEGTGFSSISIAFFLKSLKAFLGKIPSWFGYQFNKYQKSRFEKLLNYKLSASGQKIKVEWQSIQLAVLKGGNEERLLNLRLKSMIRIELNLIQAYWNYQVCPVTSCPKAVYPQYFWQLAFRADRLFTILNIAPVQAMGLFKLKSEFSTKLEVKLLQYYLYLEKTETGSFKEFLQFRIETLENTRVEYFDRVKLKERLIKWIVEWKNKHIDWSRFAVDITLYEFKTNKEWSEIIEICHQLKSNGYEMQQENFIILGEAYLKYAKTLEPEKTLTRWTVDQAVKCFYQAKAPKVLGAFPEILKSKAYERSVN